MQIPKQNNKKEKNPKIPSSWAWRHMAGTPLRVLRLVSMDLRTANLYPEMLDIIPHCGSESSPRIWKDGSMVKSACCSYRGLNSIPSPWELWLMVIYKGDPTASSDLLRHPCLCTYAPTVTATYA